MLISAILKVLLSGICIKLAPVWGSYAMLSQFGYSIIFKKGIRIIFKSQPLSHYIRCSHEDTNKIFMHIKYQHKMLLS